MDSFTLKQLRYFEALAAHGHFGNAAEVCSITQPALSIQIRELEATLGVKLFERGTRQVRLTQIGEEFARHARNVLTEVDNLNEFASSTQKQLISQLRLGVIPTIAPYMLPKLVRTLKAAYRDVDLQVRETITPRLLEELTKGQLDAAILALPISEGSFVEQTLFEENFVLVRPAWESEKPVPKINELQTERLLLLEEGHCFRDQALAFCNLTGGAPKSGLDGTSLSTLVQMVAAGIGITLIPQMAVPLETRSATVAISRFQSPEPMRRIGMIWRKSHPLSAELQKVAQTLKSIEFNTNVAKYSSNSY